MYHAECGAKDEMQDGFCRLGNEVSIRLDDAYSHKRFDYLFRRLDYL